MVGKGALPVMYNKCTNNNDDFNNKIDIVLRITLLK